ncbi:MAG: DNA polymerase III subunit delta [Desulfobacterales bacterium]|nr:MAG: DNA polymerase III subunit delta [Desulfobacterales bacterium]
MGLIKHNTLAGQLSAVTGTNAPKAVLICGDPFLVRQAFDALTSELLKGQSKSFALDTLDGKITPVGDVVEQVSTFSFLASKKVVALKDAAMFDVRGGAGERPYSAADMDVLSDLIIKGIPDNHTLVMTTGVPDRRKKIYKVIKEYGLIIDCTVAQGERKADLDEQRAVLRALSRQILAGTGKTMDTPGFDALIAQTGFNPELFAGNIEKLLAYTGSRQVITVQDIMAVVHRDKKDPIFSLTNAVMQRDTALALNLLSSLFNNGFHPLQILKSLENQVRKLLVIKCFITEIYAAHSHTPSLKHMSFNEFKQTLLEKIVAWDQQMIAKDKADAMVLAVNSEELSKKGKAKKGPAIDLLLAPNPKNPYPVFQNFRNSENFSLDELSQALTTLADLDYRMKSSGADAKTGIENFIMVLCRKGDASSCEKLKSWQPYPT